MNSAYSTKYKYQVSPSTDNFDFGPIFPKKDISGRKRRK